MALLIGARAARLEAARAAIARQITLGLFPLGLQPQSSARFAPTLTFQARPSRRLAIVRAAENHLRAVNDNHDIANRRIPITPDLDFRRSVFAGHRNTFLSRKGSLARNPSASRHTGARDGRRMSFPFRLQPKPTTRLNHFALLFMIKRERPRAIRFAWARALTAEAVRPDLPMSESET